MYIDIHWYGVFDPVILYSDQRYFFVDDEN